MNQEKKIVELEKRVEALEKKATAATAAINSEEFTEKILFYLPDNLNKKDGSVIKTVVNAVSLALQDLEKH